MTALKPIENRRVRGVASERYPLNTKCSHPECNEDVADPHHIFPRSEIGGDSWFVEVNYGLITVEGQDGYGHDVEDISEPIPHVSGLCRAHHDAVEEHRAWIKLEDGFFVWYDRVEEVPEGLDPNVRWIAPGPLDPQPAGREKAHKPKRRKFQGAARRQRTTISIKVPQDEQEDGAGIFTDYVEQLEDKLGHEPHRPVYYTLCDALAFTLQNVTTEDV